MGSCCCKEKTSAVVENGATTPTGSVYLSSADVCSPHTVDKLVMETLGVIGTLVDNEQEPPWSMQKLHIIADNEEGWIQVVTSMVNVIPMSDPLGPSVITLLLDDCPLPSRDSVLKVAQLLNLSAESAIRGRDNAPRERNICVVLGCIAEKLAGPSSVAILTEGTLNYLITNLGTETDPHVILFSLIALEKFAQTSENKSTIKKRLLAQHPTPLLTLETWHDSPDLTKRQVGFCAQWSLDNIFLTENRQYSYETADTHHINAMLNTRDVSEYLKISPDGLEARCDAYSFESVRCTTHANSGTWYYEVTVVTPGVMQIGFATKNSNFLNHEGYGIGDDKFSVAYDGCRCLIWYNARSESHCLPKWKPGDVVGCLINVSERYVTFSLNGVSLPKNVRISEIVGDDIGFFAAASFMSFQQCRFNFGAENFRYAPKDVQFEVFNGHGVLNGSDKLVMPRHLYLTELRKCSVNEDFCILCFDKRASVRLLPCRHRGFCSNCARQLTECPMCRSDFQSVQPDTP